MKTLFRSAADITLERGRAMGLRVRSLDDAIARLSFTLADIKEEADKPLAARDTVKILVWLAGAAATAQMAAEDLGLDAAVLCDAAAKRDLLDELVTKPSEQPTTEDTETAENGPPVKWHNDDKPVAIKATSRVWTDNGDPLAYAISYCPGQRTWAATFEGHELALGTLPECIAACDAAEDEARAKEAETRKE